MGVCSGCGQRPPDGARFCPACGTPTSTPGDRRREAPAERRTVTVLFADAVGSTAFAERAGDEATYRLMQECTALMVEAVERRGGTVTQFRGDGIMALFGAPVAIEHSAVEAVTAALELRDALAAYRAAASTGDGDTSSCEFRIGLSTGPVVVGRIGDDVLLDYTAVGDTANVAARMEQAAEPGTVLIADSTWRSVRSFVDGRPIGDLVVKGRSARVFAHEALRRRAVRTRLEAAVERGLGPFVGRSGELEALLALTRDVADGTGRVVEITGEAGIGKSRLLMELRRRAPDEVDWIEGHCSAGSESPYLPIADLLRHAFGVDEQDDPAAVAERVDRASAVWPEDARAVVPYLKYVLDVDPGDASVTESDARTRRAAILEALRVSLAEVAALRPRLVLIEDVHWADPTSLEAIATLAEATSRLPLLLVTTSRPGGPSLFGDLPRHHITLDGLIDGAAAELAASTLGASALPADVATLVIDKADGNPLFVEELSAALAESGLLEREGDAWRLTRAVDDIDVPGTVQEVILARIDRLAPEAREALQLAAVIGREFTVRLLDRLAGQADRLDTTLEELRAVELIRQKALFPELAYLFKHALTHEVTYSTLLDERRRALHRLVAQAIEEVYADRIAEHVEALAHHWCVAEEWGKAVEYLGRAGDAAAATFSNQAAAGFFEQGLAATEQSGDLPAATSFAWRLGQVHFTTGDMASAADAFARMGELADRIGDVESRAWALSLHGQTDCYKHDIDAGEPRLLAVIEEPGASPAVRLYAAAFLAGARAIFGRHDDVASLEPVVADLTARAHDDPRTRLVVASATTMVARWRGDIERSLELTSIEVPLDADLVFRQSLAWARGMSLGEMGRYDEALCVLEEAIARSTRTGEALMRARSYNTIGWLRGELGDHAGAVEWNERCLAYLQEVDIPDEEIESNARLNLVDSYVAAGDLGSAVTHLDRVRELVTDRPLRGTWGLWRYRQHYLVAAASLLLAQGDVAEIGGRLDDCAALATESHSVKYEGKVARARAALLREKNELDAADFEAATALRIATDIGHPPEQWRASFLLADVAAARGDTDAAARHDAHGRSILWTVAESVTDPAARAGIAGLARREAERA
jgi:class 3 adenylate cyclase/tetratricopeptide (TPR) repeat protein